MELDFQHSGLKENEYFSKDYLKKLREIQSILFGSDKSIGTAWVDYPTSYDKKEFAKILKLAKNIRETSDVLLVVGIGGSYLGAKAGLEALKPKDKFEVIFCGSNFDYEDLYEKLEYIRDKDVTVNVVSKSGTTVEILSTLNIIERFMKNKYKTEYKSRMIFTTDKSKGYLRQKATQEAIETLSVPDNMGGRYSVLSSVGLLPFACAGINIKKIMEGAEAAYKEFSSVDIENNQAYKYAVYRHLINKKLGKKIEIFTSFNTKLSSFGGWLQQLFAESEGKDKKGMYVCPQIYSTDLHSVGQFIQQGSQILAETFIEVETIKRDNQLINLSLDNPIKYLEGKNISDLNLAAQNGTIKAHSESGVPIVKVTIERLDEYNFGYLVYFFELACATSAYLLQVDPFNQPGVEQYKTYMKEILKK